MLRFICLVLGKGEKALFNVIFTVRAAVSVKYQASNLVTHTKRCSSMERDSDGKQEDQDSTDEVTKTIL